MSGIVSKTTSILNIQNGREHWHACMIGHLDGTKIGFASIEKVVKDRFGAGNYELIDYGTMWRLVAPSSLTQVRSSSLKRLKMINMPGKYLGGC